MKIGIVTDDFTGGNDIAGRFGGAGYSCFSCLGTRPSLAALESAEVLVLNARSRFLQPEGARLASRLAWRWMLKSPCPPALLFQKIDSTLRGNLAAETEGILAEGGAKWVAVVPAYPRAGRQTKGGIHYVHGLRLDRTEYARDPLNPAKEFRVDRLFDKAWSVHVPLRRVSGGATGLARFLLQMRRQSPGKRFVTFDALETRHLETIACACLKAGCRAFSGASGLGAALAKALGQGPVHGLLEPSAWREARPEKIVALAGSLSQSTLDQLALAEARRPGTWINLQPRDYLPFPPRPRPDLWCPCRQILRQSRALWLSTVGERAEAWKSLKQGKAMGLAPAQVADNAIKALAWLGNKVVDNQTAVILTGGHTAEAFFSLQGLEGAWILGELVEGLPLGRAEGPKGRRQWVASKPGGFGAPDVLLKAAERLGIL